MSMWVNYVETYVVSVMDVAREAGDGFPGVNKPL